MVPSVALEDDAQELVIKNCDARLIKEHELHRESEYRFKTCEIARLKQEKEHDEYRYQIKHLEAELEDLRTKKKFEI